jgi:hypothetical protein
MTDDSAFKKKIRARMAETGEKYTEARRMVTTGHDQGPPPVTVRVYLKPHLDLELTPEAGRVYAAADEQGRREMTDRLLRDKIEAARVTAGSAIMTDQQVRAEAEAAQEAAIRGAVQRSIERVVGLSAVEVDLAAEREHVTIRAVRPDVAWGFVRPVQTEGAWREVAADQLRRELEELTGRPVRLVILPVPDPREMRTSEG